MRTLADPVLLLAEIRAAQSDLGHRVDRRGLPKAQPDRAIVDLPSFAASLKTAWQAGEQRPTHSRPYHRHKPLAPRPSMLDPYKDQIEAWLAAVPTLAAVEVLDRLMRLAPETFTCGHLRTVQRSVKAWRTVQARSLILEGAWVMLATGSAPTSAGADPAKTHEASFNLPGNIAS